MQQMCMCANEFSLSARSHCKYYCLHKYDDMCVRVCVKISSTRKITTSHAKPCSMFSVQIVFYKLNWNSCTLMNRWINVYNYIVNGYLSYNSVLTSTKELLSEKECKEEENDWKIERRQWMKFFCVCIFIENFTSILEIKKNFITVFITLYVIASRKMHSSSSFHWRNIISTFLRQLVNKWMRVRNVVCQNDYY